MNVNWGFQKNKNWWPPLYGSDPEPEVMWTIFLWGSVLRRYSLYGDGVYSKILAIIGKLLKEVFNQKEFCRYQILGRYEKEIVPIRSWICKICKKNYVDWELSILFLEYFLKSKYFLIFTYSFFNQGWTHLV